MADTKEHRFFFRMLLSGFQAAETPDEFSRVGYYWLLIPVAGLGVLLTLLAPTSAFFVRLSSVLAKHVGLDKELIEKIPSGFVVCILIWLFGLSIPAIYRALGTLSGQFVIASLNLVAVIGEILTERRFLSFGLVIILAAMGSVTARRYYKISERQDNRIRIADRWLSELMPVVETATHSVRDIPSFQRIEPKLSESQAKSIENQIGPEWAALACLSGFVNTVFSPMRETGKSELLKGERWKLRMRGALEQFEKSPCMQVSAVRQFQDNVPAKAHAILNLMLARSYYRLEGESCSNSWALVRAFDAASRAKGDFLYSSRESIRGNIFGCAALEYSNSTTPLKELEPICHSAEDCYNLAAESHSNSANQYEPCSFPQLRALNNKADLTMKLASSKWQKKNSSEELRFLDTGTAVRSLTEDSTEMISCLGYERTPTEVTVTIAQVLGVLAQDPGLVDVVRKKNVLEKSGFFLATSVLHAPDDFGSWEMKYFCGALDSRIKEGLVPEFLGPIDLSGISDPVRLNLSRRIKEACQ